MQLYYSDTKNPGHAKIDHYIYLGLQAKCDLYLSWIVSKKVIVILMWDYSLWYKDPDPKVCAGIVLRKLI